MRLLGHYVPPIVAALPVSGEPGQEVIYQDRVHLWNTVLSKWEPELSHQTIRLNADIATSLTTYQSMFSIPVEANSLYEIDILLLHMQSSLANMKVRTSGPTGWLPLFYGSFAQHSSGAGGVSNFNINAAGEMLPNAIVSGQTNKALRSRIMGTLVTVNSGNVLFDVASSLAGSTTTILAGSFVSYRRVA